MADRFDLINFSKSVTTTLGGTAANVNIDANTLFIDGTNNRVGVGTSTPTAALQINAQDGILLGASGANSSVRIGSAFNGEGVTEILYNRSTGATSISQGNTGSALNERLRIDTSGNFQFNSGYGSVATAFGCRAWVNFDASTGTPVVRGSGNVSSITDFAVGQFGINFTTSMPDTNYCVHISHSHNSTATGFNIVGAVVVSAAQARVGTFSGTAFADYAFNYVSVFR